MLCHSAMTTNYCRQTKCGKCVNVGTDFSCDRCVNSKFKAVSDKEGVFECAGSATGIENCLTLHKPVDAPTKSGCYYCAEGFMLKAGEPEGDITPYTCVAGTTTDCAFYNASGTLSQCKYCKTGFVMDAAFTCAAGAVISDCWYQGWDGAQAVCGICNQKFGATDATTCAFPSALGRGCLDAVAGTESDTCAECSWMAGNFVFELKNDLQANQRCFNYILQVGKAVDLQARLFYYVLYIAAFFGLTLIA